MAKRVGMIDEVATIKLALKSVGLTMEMPEDGRRRRSEAECTEPSARDENPGVEAENSAAVEDTAADQSSTAPEAAAKVSTITFREDADGDQTKIYVLAAWPSKVTIAAELIAAGANPVRVAGDIVTIAVENGAAVYNKVDEDAQGSWICTLAQGSSFADPPEPPRQQPAHEASAAARRRRIAILSA